MAASGRLVSAIGQCRTPSTRQTPLATPAYALPRDLAQHLHSQAKTGVVSPSRRPHTMTHVTTRNACARTDLPPCRAVSPARHPAATRFAERSRRSILTADSVRIRTFTLSGSGQSNGAFAAQARFQ